MTSPAKIARSGPTAPSWSVGGDRYADALAASEACGRDLGALAVHAYDQAETLLGQGTLALELEQQAPALDTLLVAVGGGGSDRRHRRLVCRPGQGRGRRAGGGADAARGRSRPAGRWTRRPAGSPPIRWRRAGSAS